MSSQVGAVLVGIVAAFLFALAAYLQQRAARTTRPHGQSLVSRITALMSGLLRSRIWLLGWVINLAGFGAQAVALYMGSVALVQPLLALQLMFALPMASLERARWPRHRDWLSALAICGGLVILLVVVDATPLSGPPDRDRLLLTVGIIAVLLVVLLAVISRFKHQTVHIATAAAAGLCFSLTGVFIKLTSTDLVDHGVVYTATDWVGYGLAASTLLGMVLEQVAFANGPLPWAIATKDSVNPIASYAIGVFAFPTVLQGDFRHLAGTAAAGALLIVGAVGLAHSPSADLWLQRSNERHHQPEPA